MERRSTTMNIKLPFNRLLIVKSPIVVLTKIPKYSVYGITNRTDDNNYLLFLDYDNVEDTIVYQDIKMLQSKFNLGTCIIRLSNKRYIKSNKAFVASFHVIFFSKLPFKSMLEIMKYTRCDENFKKANFQQRCKVLRLSQKGAKVSPVFYQLIKAKSNYKCSKEHAQLFEQLDNTQITKYVNNLEYKGDIELINYITT